MEDDAFSGMMYREIPEWADKKIWSQHRKYRNCCHEMNKSNTVMIAGLKIRAVKNMLMCL